MYAVNAVNNVVLRCEGGSYIILQVGTGNGALTSAYNLAAGHSGCIFTVSPREMPIFGRVYDSAGYQFTNTGFDFARGYTVNAKNELGDSDGGTAATIVDWRGRSETRLPARPGRQRRRKRRRCQRSMSGSMAVFGSSGWSVARTSRPKSATSRASTGCTSRMHW
jgi:hypothetical protein